MSIKKTYIYGNSQILAQYDGDWRDENTSKYFYLHDRLGSVRQIIDSTASVKNCYTYDPWGLPVGDETSETFFNPYRFAGYFWDDEVSQYHCFRRQYDPVLGRFTSRDPVAGKFKEPLTLHVYLYCLNDPVNMVDPEGRFYYNLVSPILTGAALYGHGLNLATYGASSENWKFFDLAEATFKFMPVGMAVASVGVRTWPGRIAGFGTGLGIEWATDITGMGFLESGAMDYWAYLLYASYMLNEQAELGIWPWDMKDFAEWRGDW
jgi:RHS repeat-associated protein